MHAGVMKHVGEAVRDYTVAHGNKKRVVAIGIATWGCVSNKKSLINPELKVRYFVMLSGPFLSANHSQDSILVILYIIFMR